MVIFEPRFIIIFFSSINSIMVMVMVVLQRHSNKKRANFDLASQDSISRSDGNRVFFEGEDTGGGEGKRSETKRREKRSKFHRQCTISQV